MNLMITASASPALVRLVQREALLRGQCDASDDREQDRLCDIWREALAAVTAFPAATAADVALKLRTATAWDFPLEKSAEAGDNRAMAIIAALADLDHLASGGAS
jgi:hypothetical protein